MTRKHYEAIAGIIARKFVDLADNAPGMAVRATLEQTAVDLANYFASNKKFNRDNFMKACFGGE